MSWALQASCAGSEYANSETEGAVTVESGRRRRSADREAGDERRAGHVRSPPINIVARREEGAKPEPRGKVGTGEKSVDKSEQQSPHDRSVLA